MTEPYEHYRPTDGETVYRVVGTDDGVALLKVAEDGRRVNSGEVVRVTEDEIERGFEEATDPDSGLRPLRTAKGAVQGMIWMPVAFWYRLR